MLKKLSFIFLFFTLAGTGVCRAQAKRGVIGVGASAGVVTYLGDLDDHFALRFTQLGYGVHAVALVSKRIHLRVSYFHGNLAATDADAVLSTNRDRNLSFFSKIDEVSAIVMFKFQNRRHDFRKRNVLVPYVFAGVSEFHFNPKTTLDGVTYELQPIGTEGQYLGSNYPAPYKLLQMSIPVGGGFLIKMSEYFDIGAEIGWRKTFTDYIDDVSTRYPYKDQLLAQGGPIAVALSDPSINNPEGYAPLSQRGNSDLKDQYVYTNVHFTYYLTTGLFKMSKSKNRFRGNTCRGLMGR